VTILSPRLFGPPWLSPSVLAPGTAAPDFDALDQRGQPVRFGDLRGKWVVLYFYPADDTPGCTAESCAFRDDAAALQDAGAMIVGVSTQGVASHAAFASKHRLPFTLVADTTKEVCKAYGALGLLGTAKRVTYLISPEGDVVRAWRVLDPRRHSQQVLEALRASAAAAGPHQV
jgi:thioredoxin-dependent peroxiredoxin